MSFCRLCGAGFEFTGEHRPGCKALAPVQEEPASSGRGSPGAANAISARGAAGEDVLARVCDERDTLRAELDSARPVLEALKAVDPEVWRLWAQRTPEQLWTQPYWVPMGLAALAFLGLPPEAPETPEQLEGAHGE